MLLTGFSAAGFVLPKDEREKLGGWPVGRSWGRAVRARIVLACAEPAVVYAQVADDLGVTTMTVSKWRTRFGESRLAGLVDGERTGRPKAELGLLQRSWQSGRISPSESVSVLSSVPLPTVWRSG